MDVERRTLLRSIGGTTAALAIAGCVTQEDDGSDGGGDMDDGSGDDGTGGSDDDGSNDDGSDDDSGTTGQMRMLTQLNDAEEETLGTAIDAFEAETGHSVSQENVSELRDQLETAVPSGEGPQTWTWAHDWIGEFVEREDTDFIYDASDDLSVDLGVFNETAQSAVQFDGGVYGLPWGAETVALYYNENMIDEPPETLDEMVDTMEEFHNPANNEYGLSYPATNAYFASGFLQAYGGLVYDQENGEITIDDAEVVDGLETLSSTLFDYIPADPGYNAQRAAFADGLAPFAINGPWELGGFSDALDDNVGVVPLPSVDGNNPRPFAGIQAWYFGPAADENEGTLQATVDWAEWFTTTLEITQANVEQLGTVPVNTEHRDQIDLSPNVQAFSTQVERGIPTPSDTTMNSVWDPTASALSRVFNDEQEPQAALEQAGSEIRDALEE